MNTHRILNLGAGTQSSVLAIMCDRGDIPPVEVAIFADTQAEPREVYEHLDWLEKQLKRTPVVRVTAGNLRGASVEYQRSHKPISGCYASIPLYVLNGGMSRRQCTKYFKIIPIRRHVRREMKAKRATFVFGISFDERQRMRRPDRKWLAYEYPLVELGLRRQAVICLAEKWFPGHCFPRSACVECAYRRDEEWLKLSPDEFEIACQQDELLRRLDIEAGGAGVYLHRSRVPLREADLFGGDDLLFGMVNECEGMCGV